MSASIFPAAPGGPGNPFLQKVNEQIELHLDEENFWYLELARALCMSKSQLNRKIKEATKDKYAMNEYMHCYRLHRAKEMLQQGHFNVTQVALEVGYKSFTYFIQKFTDLFGDSPSRFYPRP